MPLTSLLVNTRSPKSHPLDISNPLPVSTEMYGTNYKELNKEEKKEGMLGPTSSISHRLPKWTA
ncbi:hypothetical protein CHLRE_06g271526v5 [Chlamydomonas reinhardtii]|uniref:Uncharacterized protein n=1 Tax=Chlamydomonas reinhardtii TaxID=3055 RepID=A0A2K3DNC0_CHLRE|nr:uncharacterized protein CHLRE_06g271526v5 [Chlamydomonas reinhardtii]PNW82046.1 hypothetical protein CHLRE_06g271526v5 [Chlamydomonas reinhardtii]